ncbi:MAG: hypothetical protein JWM78_471, partial [Verrucomicrobiaceae bacterium]|nr:hypothetical protein [Verrucomicrobiaceae bacterium]
GGLLGALVGAGFSEHHADDYHQRILAGSILIAAHPKDHTQSNVVYAVLAAHELKPLSAKEAHVVT